MIKQTGIRVLLFTFLSTVFAVTPCPASAQAVSGGEAELLTLLDEFLAQAGLNDRAMHQRFWAEDLVYTSSTGERFGKADIMRGLDDGVSEESALQVRYWAQDQQVLLFGDTAVVAFRLMAETRSGPGAEPSTAQLFNTGTFVRRDGEWRAVAWQATRIPEAGQG